MKKFILVFIAGFILGLTIQFFHIRQVESNLACEVRVSKFLNQTERAVKGWEECNKKLENKH
jgi:hypothetical protein